MEKWVDFLWNPCLMVLFMGVGLHCSIKTGFLQGCVPFWWRATLGQIGKKQTQSTMSQISALCMALATTIGTGSIAGVATALWLGGAGAIFWMWVSAFLGMMLSACEKVLTIEYRVPKGKAYVGGPMYYLEQGVHPFFAKWFSLACLFSAFVGGNLVQATSIAQGLHHLANIPSWVTGGGLILIVGLTLRGGMSYVAKINTILVPIMAFFYISGGLYCIIQNPKALQDALYSIWHSAFRWNAVVGGGTGYTILASMRHGVARGIFSNEGGLGVGAIAHGNAKVDHPARQGCWGMVEVCFATMVVCTLTALVILTSGVYQQDVASYLLQQGQEPLLTVGVPLTQAAFSVHLGQWGSGIVAISLVLFAFTSILGWNCYGGEALEYLTKHPKSRTYYRILMLLGLGFGSVFPSGQIWMWVDFFLALMAIPNLIGLWVLAPKATGLLNQWYTREKQVR